MKDNYTVKWLLQKILAVIFLLSATYIFFSLNNLNVSDYEIISLWFKNQFNSLIVLILFTSIFIHSNIGLTSIIDDYFHNHKIKSKILLIKNFFFAMLFFITIFSLIKLTI
ncbi:MAG: succinate dehydrogenase, hydrophobic membrane anchor protein [Pseudomonadota bacterium]|nr:succinate dehydrogenase, hydrophobic membrane anchor protein [Pseudomonadota bacterium]